MSIKDKKIILALTGGIACYKAAFLLRLLCQAGALVQVVMTEAAKQFITPLTLQALSGRPVRDDLFSLEAENAMNHIELARSADLIVIAPASANTIAKLAQGIADNLLTTLCLATHAPIMVAPAMNQIMWSHLSTQENLAILRNRGVIILGPGEGEQACGDWGLGRMIEPQQILSSIEAYWQEKIFSGKKILITAGPTRERLDPARYLSNFSSGKMGYALASVAVELGADVVLITGPSELLPPPKAHTVLVESALEMQAAVLSHLNHVDIFIGAAAIADYRPKAVKSQKIKKGKNELILELAANPDIIAEVSFSSNRPRCVVGFAAESENLISYAQQKLHQKNLDYIIVNDISSGKVFGKDHNEVIILGRDGFQENLPLMSKKALAQSIFKILNTFISMLNPGEF